MRAVPISASLCVVFLIATRAGAQAPVPTATQAQDSLTDSTSQIVTCTMLNGDRLSGKFVAFKEGRLTLQSPYVARTVLTRATVSFCQATDTSVQRRIATMLLPKNPLAVAMPLPAQTIKTTPKPPPPPKLAVLRPTMSVIRPNSSVPFIHEKYGWRRAVNLNYAYSTGNANAVDGSLVVLAVRTLSRSRTTVQTNVRSAHRDGARTAQLFTALFRYDRAIGETPKSGASPSLFQEVGYEQNRLAKLTGRYLANVGVSLPVVTSKEQELAFDLGVGATRERYTTGVDETKGGAVVRLTSRQTLFAGAKATQQVTALPDLDRTGRYRVNANVVVAAPLSKSLSLRVTLDNRYDTRPQRAVKKNDLTIQSGIGVEF